VTDKTSGKGAKFAYIKKVDAPGAPDLKSKVEITEWEAGKKIAFRSYEGFENGGVYGFTAAGNGTRVTLTNTYDLASILGGKRGGFLGGLAKSVGGVLEKGMERQVLGDLEKSLQKLKTLVESTPGKTAAKPAARAKAKPAPKPAAKTAPKPAAKAKPATKTPAKAKPVAKAKPATKPAAKAKPVAKAVAKPKASTKSAPKA
jgi:predicted lipid-binding transport protein (Tim44 family)